jgi:hypothetical protein
VSQKANWFLDGLVPVENEPDPFAVPIEEVGQRVDLRDPQAALKLRLQELLGREAKLFERQITCDIKDRSDTCCHACPVSKAHDPEDRLGILCRIGREEELVSTELAVHVCREARCPQP